MGFEIPLCDALLYKDTSFSLVMFYSLFSALGCNFVFMFFLSVYGMGGPTYLM